MIVAVVPLKVKVAKSPIANVAEEGVIVALPDSLPPPVPPVVLFVTVTFTCFEDTPFEFNEIEPLP